MERRRHALWALRWCSFFASVAIAAITRPVGGQILQQSLHESPHSSSCSSQKSRNLIIVSTVDGKVSALNAARHGALEWSVKAGDTPLVSSSIGNLEVLQDGVKSRIIPSLGGTLFQFDGQSIKPMQIDADLLLSASFRMGDDSYIVGGKETMTFGVNVSTGKLKYVCGISGCTQLEDDSKAGSRADEDVLVLIRQTRTIRAVEMRTGHEKWNFSVGQHEVSLINDEPDLQDYKRIMNDARYDEHDENYEDEDATVRSCEYNEEDDREHLFMWTHDGSEKMSVQLRLLVPEGIIMAVNKDNPDEIVWSHKFESAIATAWSLVGGELEQISIFDEPAVPALQLTNAGSPYQQEPNDQPLLYIGEYENQFYCQESLPMQRQISDAFHNAGPGDHSNAVMPVIRWRPYIATEIARYGRARSRTPAALGGINPLQIEYERRQAESHGLVTWHRQYPYDNGYYLFPDTTPLDDEDLEKESEYAIFYNVAVAMPSLWIWWKEVLAISLGTAVIFNIFIFKYYGKMVTASSNSRSKSIQEGVPIGNEVEETPADIVTMSSSISSGSIQGSAEYVSRYCTEFDRKVCLGKGGFGVVFEAVNKMDDCSYAIKRITLKNSNKARERVMREVKALAKLDNSGIVRYYQAWFESPPQGWQEERDRQLFSDLTSAAPSAVGDPTNEPLSSFGGHTKGFSSGDGLDINPLNPFMGPGENPLRQLDWELTQRKANCDNKKKGSSTGFTPHIGNPDSSFDEQSQSRREFFVENSVSIEFRNSDSETSYSAVSHHLNTQNVPFGQYDNKVTNYTKGREDTEESFSVVFEDSGCGNKSEDEMEDISEENVETDTVENALLSHVCDVADRSRSRGIAVPRTRTFSRSSSSPARSQLASKPGSVSGSPVKLSQSLPARPDSLDLTSEIPKDRSKQEGPVPKLYLYIQMQLCRRETLKDWLNDNTLNRDRKILLDIFDQIVSAVDYIHDCGLMHRDLKPSNIFFSLDGSVKVGDFGLVTAFEEQPHMTEKDRTPMFNHNITNQVGTKLYMSPEQGEARHYTHKVDIYSLGLILFELFYPFSTQMERVLLLQDVRKSVFPHRFAKELPDVMALVKQLLAVDPMERPSTKDIQHNPLLKDFEAARQILNRMRPRARTQTTSTASESSNSEDFVTAT